MRLNSERIAFLGFGCLALVVVFFSTRSQRRTEDFYAAAQAAMSAADNLTLTETVIAALNRAEAVKRRGGYSLQADHLLLVASATATLARQIDELAQRLNESGRTPETDRLIEQLADQTRALQLREARRTLNALKDQETHALKARQNEFQVAYEISRSGRFLRSGFIISTILGLCLLLGLAIRDRAAQSQTIADERERFRVTLTSIGDGVITTDPSGTITFMNPAAEWMTGYSANEALGQPVSEVLRLVDYRSAASLECPVETVLMRRTRMPVRGNSLLVSRQRIAHEIESSASPICNSDGRVVGTVFVFFRRSGESKFVAANSG